MDCLHKILVKKKPWLPPVRVPCGQCIACRLNRASDWAVRIMHEKKMSGDACFLTLTYNQEKARWVSDKYCTLIKKDIQNFIKRLRKALEPLKIRYYLCGEYGEERQRAHYHIILFGYWPKDAIKFKRVNDYWLYISPFLNSVWREYNKETKEFESLGYVTVGEVTYDSACYTAKYCTKLLTGKLSMWYKERNLTPEFALMSRKPGIGFSWLEKYGNEVKTHHNVVVKGKKMAPPRYYRDKVYDEVDRSVVRSSVVDKIIKENQRRLDDYELYEESLSAKEATILKRLAMKKRG